MAARTPDTTYYGALGAKDPGFTVPQVTVARSIDFSVTPMASTADAAKDFAILPLPAGLLVTSVAIVQKSFTNEAVALTVGPKSNGSTTYASATTAASGTLVGVHTVVANGSLIGATADTLCINVPANKTLNEGEIEVFVTGIKPLSDTFTAAEAGTPAWRNTLQTTDNVSGGQIDPRKYEGPTA